MTGTEWLNRQALTYRCRYQSELAIPQRLLSTGDNIECRLGAEFNLQNRATDPITWTHTDDAIITRRVIIRLACTRFDVCVVASTKRMRVRCLHLCLRLCL
jgi:hypothetical protein